MYTMTPPVPVHGEDDNSGEDDGQDHKDDDEKVQVHAQRLHRQHVLHVAAVLKKCIFYKQILTPYRYAGLECKS